MTTVLDLPPSCIEFVPFFPNHFVVGTYNLESDDTREVQISSAEEHGQNAAQERKTQSRSGSLILCRLEFESLSHIQTIPTNSAVLDLHFSPNNGSRSHANDGHSRLAVATSAGAIEIYSLVAVMQTSSSFSLTFIRVIQAFDSSLLLLSLAFNPVGHESEALAVTLSDGSVAVLNRGEPVQAHSLEVWTVAWSSVVDDDGRQTLYSGGDDSRLCTSSYQQGEVSQEKEALVHTKLTDDMENSKLPQCIDSTLKTAASSEKAESIISTDIVEAPLSAMPSNASLELIGFDGRIHGAGVTAILPINLGSEGQPQAEVLLTGSYDEFVRILFPKQHGKWTVVAEKRLGGGVWRLKYLSPMDNSPGLLSRHSILASCMHAGARIVEVSHHADDGWAIRVFARLEEHDSMNYGSDLVNVRDAESKERNVVVSTSFYDRKLCVTQVPDLV